MALVSRAVVEVGRARERAAVAAAEDLPAPRPRAVAVAVMVAREDRAETRAVSVGRRTTFRLRILS